MAEVVAVHDTLSVDASPNVVTDRNKSVDGEAEQSTALCVIPKAQDEEDATDWLMVAFKPSKNSLPELPAAALQRQAMQLSFIPNDQLALQPWCETPGPEDLDGSSSQYRHLAVCTLSQEERILSLGRLTRAPGYDNSDSWLNDEGENEVLLPGVPLVLVGSAVVVVYECPVLSLDEDLPFNDRFHRVHSVESGISLELQRRAFTPVPLRPPWTGEWVVPFGCSGSERNWNGIRGFCGRGWFPAGTKVRASRKPPKYWVVFHIETDAPEVVLLKARNLAALPVARLGAPFAPLDAAVAPPSALPALDVSESLALAIAQVRSETSDLLQNRTASSSARQRADETRIATPGSQAPGSTCQGNRQAAHTSTAERRVRRVDTSRSPFRQPFGHLTSHSSGQQQPEHAAKTTDGRIARVDDQSHPQQRSTLIPTSPAASPQTVAANIDPELDMSWGLAMRMRSQRMWERMHGVQIDKDILKDVDEARTSQRERTRKSRSRSRPAARQHGAEASVRHEQKSLHLAAGIEDPTPPAVDKDPSSIPSILPSATLGEKLVSQSILSAKAQGLPENQDPMPSAIENDPASSDVQSTKAIEDEDDPQQLVSQASELPAAIDSSGATRSHDAFPGGADIVRSSAMLTTVEAPAVDVRIKAEPCRPGPDPLHPTATSIDVAMSPETAVDAGVALPDDVPVKPEESDDEDMPVRRRRYFRLRSTCINLCPHTPADCRDQRCALRRLAMAKPRWFRIRFKRKTPTREELLRAEVYRLSRRMLKEQRPIACVKRRLRGKQRVKKERGDGARSLIIKHDQQSV